MSEANETTYQGWTNHATWCVNLHMTNDQGIMNAVNNLVSVPVDIPQHVREYDPADQLAYQRRMIADRIRDYVSDLTTGEAGDELSNAATGAGLCGLLVWDLVRGYLDDVNWREIVEVWLDK